jgi:hypothetical protein
MMYYSDEYLCHYGVLGMKWGQHLFGKTEASSAGRKRASKSDRASAGAYRAGITALGGIVGGITGGVAGSAATTLMGLSFTSIATMATATVATGGAALGAAIGLGAASKTVNKAYERLKSGSYDTMSKAITGVHSTNQVNRDKKSLAKQNSSRFATNNSKLAEQAINKLTDDEYYAIYKMAYRRGRAAGSSR